MGGIFEGCMDVYDCCYVGGCYFWSHSMLILLPAKTIVLMVVLRSELSPRFSVFWGYYVCFLSCMFEELCWLLGYSCFLPPEACPTCCLLCVITWKVVYASVLSVVFGFIFRVNRVCQRV